MSAPSSAPVAINYPENAYGSGRNTHGRPSPSEIDPSLDPNERQIIAQGGLVDSQIQPVAIPTNLNTCFRDVVLMGLFSLKPFVGYIEHCANLDVPADALSNGAKERDFVLKSLHTLVQEFWRATTDNNGKRKLLKQLAGNFHNAWNNFGDQNPTVQDDTLLYLQAVLEKLDPGFPPASDAFPLLFWNQFVARNAFECGCPEKSREPQHNVQDDRFVCPIFINQQNQTLEDALAWSLYDRQGENESKCPSCGKIAKQHRFLKWRYLPEVLFLELGFITTDKAGQQTPDYRARCTLPEEIDLDVLQDKIDKTLGQDIDDPATRDRMQRDLLNKNGVKVNVAQHSRYKLQFVVDYSGSGSAGHYRCNTRSSGGQWTLLDGNISRGPAKPTTLQQIQNHKHFQPRLVAYVRQYDEDQPVSEISGKVSQVVPPKGVTPSTTIPDSLDNQSTAGLAEPVVPATTSAEQTGGPITAEVSSDQQVAYEAWDIKKLKEEISKRGLALPPQKNVGSLQSLLRQHDENPKDYNLFTVKHLNEELKKRNIVPAGKKAPVKKEVIKLLVEHDTNLGSSVQARTSIKRLPAAITGVGTTRSTQQIQDLQLKVATLINEKQELQLKVNSYSITLQDMLKTADQSRDELEAALADAEDRAQKAEEAGNALKDQYANVGQQKQSSQAQYFDTFLLSISISVSVPATINQSGYELSQQYLIGLEGHQPEDFRDATVVMSAMEDPSSNTTLVVKADISIPSDTSNNGGPWQHIINVEIPNVTDVEGLRMSSETEIVKLMQPICVGYSAYATNPVPAQSDVQSSLKRQTAEMGWTETSPSGERPAKRQKL